MDLVSAELPAKTLVVGIDPGKAANRVLLATGEKGVLGEPVSLPTRREGIERLCELIAEAGAPQTVIAIEQNRYSPSLETAFRIARHFGVGVEEVFVWVGEG